MSKILNLEEIKELSNDIGTDIGEKFFRCQVVDFIDNIAEVRDENPYKLTKENIEDIVNNLLASDDIWQVIDEQIGFELLSYKKSRR